MIRMNRLKYIYCHFNRVMESIILFYLLLFLVAFILIRRTWRRQRLPGFDGFIQRFAGGDEANGFIAQPVCLTHLVYPVLPGQAF